MSMVERSEAADTAEARADRVQIYALRDPNTGELRYVGRAADPQKRLVQHLQPGQLERYRSRKNSWLKGLVKEGLRPLLEIIDDVESERGDEAERYWIAWYRSQGAPLTNGTEGGVGGAITCPDARERIRAAHLGSKASAETRARMSETAKRRAADPVERERLRSISNGKPPVHNGEANPRAKLTDEQVRELRNRAAAGETLRSLASEYGITAASVTQLVTGRSRKTAGGPIREPLWSNILRPQDARLARKLYRNGASLAELAVQFGVSHEDISDVISYIQRRRDRLVHGGFFSGD